MGELPMEKATHLRRQAALCLSLSRFTLDPLVAEHLTSMAALFQEGALRAGLADADESAGQHSDTAQPMIPTRH
jgi:hypothetical protein